MQAPGRANLYVHAVHPYHACDSEIRQCGVAAGGLVNSSIMGDQGYTPEPRYEVSWRKGPLPHQTKAKRRICRPIEHEVTELKLRVHDLAWLRQQRCTRQGEGAYKLLGAGTALCMHDTHT